MENRQESTKLGKNKINKKIKKILFYNKITKRKYLLQATNVIKIL